MLLFSLTFIVWAVVHSVTAAAAFKNFIRQKIGAYACEGLYRLLYNLLAFLTLLPVLYFLITAVPATVIWTIPQPFDLVARLVQGVGFVGLLVALLQTDVWEFAGIRQAVRYLSGEDDLTLPPKLVTSGTYALVRHPLYFFSLLIIWFNPLVTLQILIFNIMATVYLWVGSTYEERRLAAAFGERYRAYRQKVPRLIPIPWRLGADK